MHALRTHLRSWTLGWLVCQLLALSAFLPPACCAAHEDAAAGTECHGMTQGSADEVCPMHAAGGEVCPMHAGTSAPAHDHASHQPSADDALCVMGGLCDGPSLALGALLSLPGILPEPAAMSVTLAASQLDVQQDVVPDPLPSHDTPPPRL